MHFPNTFIRFFAFVSSFLFPKQHTTSHTHTTNQRNRRFYNSLLSSFPFPGSSCAASTQQRVQGTTPRIDEPLVPSLNLNEMNVEELDKERAIKLWQLTIFHPFRSEVVSFNVSVIEKEKIAKKKKKITKESAPRFVSAAVRERSRNLPPHKHIILCFFSFQYFFVYKFVPSRERERNQQQQTKTTRM